MHFPVVLAALTLLTSSILAAPAGATSSPLPTHGTVTSPAPNALFFKGDTIQFSYKRSLTPGYETNHISLNLNTPNSTFLLATDLHSSLDIITGTFKIPDLIFYYLGPSGVGPGYLQVTEYQSERPSDQIFPPATQIRLREEYPLVPGSPGTVPA
ncbi:hypothetical protein RQP46_007802 [Phenoliferia psychrophenolica]